MAKRLALFNHKGGVSKTTSAYNIGWMLAEDCNVLLVDGDPQCNLSSLILGDGFEQYYLEDSTRLQNLKDGVAPTFEGRPVAIQPVDCFAPTREPNLRLLAGHANLSEYDAALTFAQMSNNALSTLQNLPGAFSELLRLTEEKYSIDYTIIDLNPSLSAINQNLFLSSHAFIVPTNPDPFSIMALNTLKTLLPRWASWKLAAIPLFANSAYPLTDGVPKFVGSLIQRFNIRKGKPARPYRDNIQEIKDRITGEFVGSLAQSGMALTSEQYGPLVAAEFCLAEIPDFQGLLPKSQNIGVPVFAVEDDEIQETGPILAGLIEKRDLFYGQFTDIADQIDRLLKYA
jgi:chromosome partitioning protein